MRRSVPLAIVACMLALGSFAPVAAQDDEIAASQQPAVGAPNVYVDEVGTERAHITIIDVEDPFTGFPPGNEPAEDMRYVLLTVMFENIGQQPFEARPDHILLQDATGILWRYATVRRGDDIVVPDLSRVDMAPGDRVSGMVGYQVSADVELANVYYQPQSSQLVLLANLQPAPNPERGSDVPFTDAEGAQLALVTVTDVEDPFTGFPPGNEPPEDTRYVLLTIAFDNTGQQPFEPNPSAVILQDTDGFLWSATSVRRGDDIVIPDLQRQQMAPGNRISGVVGFRVPIDAELANIYYQPESSRLILLADLQPDTAPAPVATPVATGGTSAATLDSDCAEMEPWLIETAQHIGYALDMRNEAALLEDPVILEVYAPEFAGLADAQAAMTVPDSVLLYNAEVILVFTAYYEALTQIITAGDDGGDISADLMDGMNAFNDATREFNELIPRLIDLATSCDIEI